MQRACFATLSVLICYAGHALAAPPLAVPARAAPPPPSSPSAASATTASRAEGGPSASPASTPNESQLAEARRLGSRGLVAYDRGDHDAAIESLTRAILLHDAISLRLYRARSFAKLGRWDAACDDYDAIVLAPAARGETAVAAQARAVAVPEGEGACSRVTDRVYAPGSGAAPASPPDSAPPASKARGELPTDIAPTLQLDFSFFGSMNNRVWFSRSEFATYDTDSASMAGRLALSWYPLPDLDWLGFGASWVQDYGTGPFHYTEALASVMSRYLAGPWRFGAQLGGGFLHTGVDVLNQRYILLKPSVDAGVQLGNFSTSASFGLLAPLTAVGSSLYGDYRGYGVEGRLALDYRLWRWLGVQLSAALSRLEFDLDSPDGDANLDGGDMLPDMEPPSSVTVVDRYTTVLLSLSVNL
jgi:tetratricopeptide (TPR) repeat protein